MELVKLNVGGTKYTTTRQTLCRYPDSMLGAMFGGDMPSTQDEEGRYFIDRNGRSFVYILDFLRSSQLILPEDFQHVDQLLAEADFYQIEPLISAVRKIKEKREIQEKSQYQYPVGVKGYFLEVMERATPFNLEDRVRTTVYGRRDIISELPSQFIGEEEKIDLQENGRVFIKMEFGDKNVRLQLAHYLQSQGWRQLGSDMTLSDDEIFYRDRWFLPTDRDIETIEDPDPRKRHKKESRKAWLLSD